MEAQRMIGHKNGKGCRAVQGNRSPPCTTPHAQAERAARGEPPTHGEKQRKDLPDCAESQHAITSGGLRDCNCQGTWSWQMKASWP
eukprot:114901-Heterocapsa_arctica.AAC.1